MMRIVSTAGMIWAAATAAVAHPHIFIDAGLHPIFDQDGQLAAVRVIWTYDDLYSLLVLEDLQLDQDYDGALSPDEEAALTGFDMHWLEGYQGDLYVLRGGQPVALSGPTDYTATLVDGRITTTHVRTFDAKIAVGEDPVIFQAYDPEFYTAYHLTLPTRIEGREGCAGQLFQPDLDEANQILLDALAEVGADTSLEEAGFPAVGAQFADEIRLTCAPPS